MTPEQEEQVARALAQTARHEPVPPLPDEVASRLDDVLADLVTERGAGAAGRSGTAAEGSGASVAELSEHRRRRRPQLLTAAAAVALVVAAGAAIANGGLGGTSSDESASTSAGGGSAAEQRPDAAGETARGAGPGQSAARATAPRLRTPSLAADVRRLLASDRSADLRDRPGPRRKALTGPPLAAGGCAVPSAGPGEQVLAVRLDGRPATLLLGPVRGDTRSAEVYRCGDAASPAASVTVPLP